MAFSFTLPSAVASGKDAFAFDFLQEAVVIEVFFSPFFADVFLPCMPVGEHERLLGHPVSGWPHTRSPGWTFRRE